MNVDHTKLYIQMQINGQPYHITVERENNDPHPPVYWAYGAEYTDPMESSCGFGDTREEALAMFIEAKYSEQKEAKTTIFSP